MNRFAGGLKTAGFWSLHVFLLAILCFLLVDFSCADIAWNSTNYTHRGLQKAPDWVPRAKFNSNPKYVTPKRNGGPPLPEEVLAHIKSLAGEGKQQGKSRLRYHSISIESRNFSRAEMRKGAYLRMFAAVPSNTKADNFSCLLNARQPSSTGSLQHKILIFIDSKFFPLYQNWHLHYLDVCGEARLPQLELVCMDQLVSNHLTKLNVTCSKHSLVIPSSTASGMFTVKRQASIWVHRMEVILSYLQRGVDLILTDSDAIWRADPYIDLNRYYAKADIIASRGSFPATLYHTWGATICMGYIFVKATPFTVQFMESVLQDMRERGVIMERIQHEITIRERILGVDNDSSLGDAKMLESLRRKHRRERQRYLDKRMKGQQQRSDDDMVLIRKRKVRTKRGTSTRNDGDGTMAPLPPAPLSDSNGDQQRSFLRSIFGRRRLESIEKDAEDVVDEEDAVDIPDPNQVAAALDSAENEDENETPLSISHRKYSSDGVEQAIRWIVSDDMHVYNPALERFHRLLLAGQVESLFDSRALAPAGANISTERHTMDILHFLYDVRDLEGNKPDDQYTMNYMLYRWSIAWQQLPMHVVVPATTDTAAADGAIGDQPSKLRIEAFPSPASSISTETAPMGDFGVIRVPGSSLRGGKTATVMLLPHTTYLRNCTGIAYHRRTRGLGHRNAKQAVARKDVVIAHCLLSPGDANKKYLSLRSYKLWHPRAPRISQARIAGRNQAMSAPPTGNSSGGSTKDERAAVSIIPPSSTSSSITENAASIPVT